MSAFDIPKGKAQVEPKHVLNPELSACFGSSLVYTVSLHWSPGPRLGPAAAARCLPAAEPKCLPPLWERWQCHQ